MKKIVCFICLLMSYTTVQAAEPSPFTYVVDGEPANARQWITGNPTNWYNPWPSNDARQQGALTVEKVKNSRKSIRAIWASSKDEHALYLTGPAIDLSAQENNTALYIELKINQMPSGPVQLRMDCGYPCSGAITLNPLIAKAILNTWFWIPVPLNCFSKAGTALNKVDTVLQLQTAASFDINIANVKLVRLPDDYNGCAK